MPSQPPPQQMQMRQQQQQIINIPKQQRQQRIHQQPPLQQQQRRQQIAAVLTARQQQIKDSKDAALNLGFDPNRIENEMKIFLDVVKVSGHSLNPSCFLNFLCEITANEQ